MFELSSGEGVISRFVSFRIVCVLVAFVCNGNKQQELGLGRIFGRTESRVADDWMGSRGKTTRRGEVRRWIRIHVETQSLLVLKSNGGGLGRCCCCQLVSLSLPLAWERGAPCTVHMPRSFSFSLFFFYLSLLFSFSFFVGRFLPQVFFG